MIGWCVLSFFSGVIVAVFLISICMANSRDKTYEDYSRKEMEDKERDSDRRRISKGD